MNSKFLFASLAMILGVNSLFQAQTVTIGTQVWTTKNLDVSTFRNGDVIPQASSDEAWIAAGENKQPAWCYYDNDTANASKYGKLYNWYAVNDSRGLAPEGYHIPSDAEWTVLTDYLGGESVAGVKMRSESGWEDEFNGTNSSGFSGFPGGGRHKSGRFNDSSGAYGKWWSASEFVPVLAWSLAWCRHTYYFFSKSERLTTPKGNGLSVRCIKD